MSKHYQVLEDNFLWQKGAILKQDEDGEGYRPIDDLWDTTEENGNEYISARIIEAPENKQYFQRVYVMSKGKKVLYLTKEKAREASSKFYEGKE